jgi:hypothetical protein
MDYVELLLPIIRDLIIVIVIAVVGFAVKWWRDLTIDNWIKELVIDGVLFAQEKFWELTGEEKFEQAKQWILDRLKEKGVNVSEEWLEGLIDAIVKQLRAEFGDEDWYREEG